MNEDVRKLAELGMVPQLAKELVTQVESGTTDVRRLVELTMVPELAKEVTAQISEGDSDVRRLVELGMPPTLASLVSSIIEGGVGNKLLVVATRGEVSPVTFGAARTAGNEKQRFRKRAFIGAGGLKAGTAQLALSNYRTQVNLDEQPCSEYIASGHIEIGGVAHPFTWNGGNPTAVIASGAAEVLSDPLADLPDVPAGTEVKVLLVREYAIGGNPAFNTTPSPGISGDGAQQAASGVNAGVGTPGALVAGGGWSNMSSVFDAPFALLGQQITPAPAIITFGASIETVSNDIWGDGVNGAGAYVRRGLWPSSGTKYAALMAPRNGDLTATFLERSARRREYLKHANVCLLGYGGNDFSQGVPVETVLENLAVMKTAINAAGITKIGFLRMAPKTNAVGDDWTTTANQTVRTGFLEYRAEVDAGVASLGMTLVDVTAAYEEPGMPGIWKAAYTTDGTHPSPTAHGEAANLLQSALGPLIS